MTRILVIGLGGFVGAIARYGLSGLVQRRFGGVFPLGTLCVNVLGCLAIGLLISLIQERAAFSTNLRLFLTIGLLGSFTTFSTLGYETTELVRQGSLRYALLNVLASLVVGYGAVELGRFLGRLGLPN